MGVFCRAWVDGMGGGIWHMRFGVGVDSPASEETRERREGRAQQADASEAQTSKGTVSCRSLH
jgi:hypothetical protein